ncbi:helix-hairpin-helix domain-containing protein [Nocardioides sp. LHG3406-4]|uniref:helix-hairpin-helix domain-containing protein n=1 Tax=Nocardioides sp. LHG3406-4 TaxID=2804575 RepID=UPI003CE83ACC
MRSRRPSPEHQEAVTRRLALLSAELATVRPDPDADPYASPGSAPVHPHTRIRAVLDEAPWDQASERGVPAVPMPGRHARPSGRARVAELVPETLRGRVSLSHGAVTVVALVLCAALALTCWWLVRSDPQEVQAPQVAEPWVEVSEAEAGVASAAPGETASEEAAPEAGAESGPGEAAAEVTVDVAGKVRRPGIAVLPTGSRVVDALEAAGGARRGVDLTSLNLARPLVDGEQVLVGVASPGTPASTDPGGTTPGAPAALVNINTADQAALETLPGIGPVTAGSIIAWRTEHGGFTSVDELLEVDGIGDATLEQLVPHVTI